MFHEIIELVLKTENDILGYNIAVLVTQSREIPRKWQQEL